ncbi:hypothetical protein J6590_079045 [Homalodisca vitripennis]|nr:hypothetical protein J6590_079045 [Homalodisca vitripennis]
MANTALTLTQGSTKQFTTTTVPLNRVRDNHVNGAIPVCDVIQEAMASKALLVPRLSPSPSNQTSLEPVGRVCRIVL